MDEGFVPVIGSDANGVELQNSLVKCLKCYDPETLTEQLARMSFSAKPAETLDRLECPTPTRDRRSRSINANRRAGRPETIRGRFVGGQCGQARFSIKFLFLAFAAQRVGIGSHSVITAFFPVTVGRWLKSEHDRLP